MAALAAICLVLTACGSETPRTPYEARQKLESLGNEVTEGKQRLDRTADATVQATKDGLTAVGEGTTSAVDGVVEALGPAVDLVKDGLTTLGNGLLNAAKDLKEGGPPPEGVTQPHRNP